MSNIADLITRAQIWFTDDCGYCGLVPDPERMCPDCWEEMICRSAEERSGSAPASAVALVLPAAIRVAA